MAAATVPADADPPPPRASSSYCWIWETFFFVCVFSFRVEFNSLISAASLTK
jgi:hypothetical protein